MLVKPEKDISNIIRLIEDDVRISHFKFMPGDVFDMKINNENCLICIVKGTVSIHRKNDDMLIINRHAPTVIGLTGIFSPTNYHYIVCNDECEAFALRTESARELFSQKNSWERVSRILAYINNLYYERDKLISGGTTYEIIKSHLEYIWNLPDDTRKSISIYEFILKRNHISRSSLHKIAKELKKGGYIETMNGKLLSLKMLPKKF